MRLKRLSLQTFRNYETLDLHFDDDILLLYGANAQGKTNILEAVFLCTCARSHRTGKDLDLVKNGENGYYVSIVFETDDGLSSSLDIHYRVQGGRREIFVDGMKLPRISDLMGRFHAVVFAPEDLSIVKDGPAERRRFLDLFISQLHPRYFRELSIFFRILQQRNALLKKLRDREYQHGDDSEDDLLLDIWDEKLAAAAAYIIFMRARYANHIADLAATSLAEITDEKETLRLRYRSPGISNFESLEKIEEACLKRLRTVRQDDIFRGITGSGPHRDDMELFLDEKDVRVYASQGQQRSVTLALKIAQLRILHSETGEAPVLLLDDVMSELDVGRRTNLLNSIAGYQVLLTCTDLFQVFPPAVAKAVYADRAPTKRALRAAKDSPGRLGSTAFYEVSGGTVRWRTFDRDYPETSDHEGFSPLIPD